MFNSTASLFVSLESIYGRQNISLQGSEDICGNVWFYKYFAATRLNRNAMRGAASHRLVIAEPGKAESFRTVLRQSRK